MKKKVIALISFMIFIIPNCKALEKGETKYFKTIYNDNDIILLNEEITEEEYNSSEIIPYGSELNTEYKQLNIKINEKSVILTCTWKNIPKYKSFDVIAIRGSNVAFNSSSVYGEQFFIKNNIQSTIDYYNTTSNTKIFGSGVGISMNLVNDATAYTLRMSLQYEIVGSNPIIYGSYQHATRNVDLETSKKYTINPSGYGKVILFESPVNSYYDKMDGVEIKV